MAIISLFTDPLFSLQSLSRARDKNKWSSSRLIFFSYKWPYWPPAQGGRGGGRRKYFSFSRSALADVFEKNENKNKRTSVYRWAIMREMSQSCFNFEPMTLFVGPFSTELIQWNKKTFGTLPLVNQHKLESLFGSQATSCDSTHLKSIF